MAFVKIVGTSLLAINKFFDVCGVFVVAMSALNKNLIVLATLSCILVLVNTQSVHRRFEYKYSFKPPYLAQKDGSVPFWEYGGSEY